MKVENFRKAESILVQLMAVQHQQQQMNTLESHQVNIDENDQIIIE